jgi:dUTP diphosphatase
MTTIRYKLTNPDGPPVTLPAYKTDGSSGMDLCTGVPHTFVIFPGETSAVPTGLAIELPPRLEAQIRPRSSMSMKALLCHFGTIDSDYRGEIKVLLTNVGQGPCRIDPGDRIAQLVIAPVERVTLVPADELSATGRGSGAFGSTGR